MTFGLDFAKLDLRDALDFAIGIEEDAQLRYQEFTRLVVHPGARQFFAEMVVNETKHRRQLESRRDVLFRKAPRRFDTSVDAAVEAPDPSEVTPEISVLEAMQVALRAETRAFEFYASAIPHLRDPDVRAFFEELKEEEVQHQAAIRDMIAKLCPELDGTGTLPPR
jgi:rubrerythrin